MTDKQTPTPTPWTMGKNKVGYVYGPDVVVAKCGDFSDKELTKFNGDRWNADAALIVRAVNSHEALTEFARCFLAAEYRNADHLAEMARAALALAEGTP